MATNAAIAARWRYHHMVRRDRRVLAGTSADHCSRRPPGSGYSTSSTSSRTRSGPRSTVGTFARRRFTAAHITSCPASFVGSLPTSVSTTCTISTAEFRSTDCPTFCAKTLSSSPWDASRCFRAFGACASCFGTRACGASSPFERSPPAVTAVNATAASAPIPKFASVRGKLGCELRNQRGTSNSIILVWFSNLKFLCEVAAK